MGLIFAKLLGLFPVGWPELVRKVAAWATVAIAIAGLLWAAKAAYDDSVIDEHENEKAIESIGARDEAAEERAADIIKHTLEAKEAHDAINSVPAGDAQHALDCLRLKRVNIFPVACGHPGGDGSEADPD